MSVIQLRSTCGCLIGLISGSLLVFGLSAVESVRAHAILICLGVSLFSVPASVTLGIIEWHRPEPAILWPLMLFFVSVLPLLLFIAVVWISPQIEFRPLISK